MPEKIGGTSVTPIVRTPPWDAHSLLNTFSHQRWYPRPNMRIKIGKGQGPVLKNKGSARVALWQSIRVHRTSTR